MYDSRCWFGRPWREGLVNVAVGLSGFEPIVSYLGETDPAGHVLQATILALADELASAAEPVMGLRHLQSDRPAADDDQVLGKHGVVEQSLVGQIIHRVEARDRRHERR